MENNNKLEKDKVTTESQEGFILFTVLSIGILINVVFIPMFNVWGGIGARWSYYNQFFAALNNVEHFLEGSNRLWSDIFIWSAFVPAVVLLISSIAKKKVMVTVSSFVGTGLLLFNLNRHISDYYRAVGASAINFYDGNISIGFWIALILFSICLLRTIPFEKISNRLE